MSGGFFSVEECHAISTAIESKLAAIYDRESPGLSLLMNGGSHTCIGPLNTEGVSLNVHSKGGWDSYDSNSQGMGVSRS